MLGLRRLGATINQPGLMQPERMHSTVRTDGGQRHPRQLYTDLQLHLPARGGSQTRMNVREGGSHCNDRLLRIYPCMTVSYTGASTHPKPIQCELLKLEWASSRSDRVYHSIDIRVHGDGYDAQAALSVWLFTPLTAPISKIPATQW